MLMTRYKNGLRRAVSISTQTHDANCSYDTRLFGIHSVVPAETLFCCYICRITIDKDFFQTVQVVTVMYKYMTI